MKTWMSSYTSVLISKSLRWRKRVMSIELALAYIITAFALLLAFVYSTSKIISPYAWCKYYERLGILKDARCEEIIVKND